MAGTEVASPFMQHHTLQKEDTRDLDDRTLSVSDTTGPEELPLGYHSPPDRCKTIVLFGEMGAGKSSLVNLMAGETLALTSPDVQRCTLNWKDYPIEFGGDSYNVFDTRGLEELQLGVKEYLEAVENACRLIKELDKRGGIDLLLFCIRAGRLTATVKSNYRLFHEFLCEKKVPIVLAITHLETEEKSMEDWWKRNHGAFDRSSIHVAGHACVTAVDKGKLKDSRRHEESRVAIHNLIKKHTADGQRQAWIGGDNLFVSLLRKLKELLAGNLRLKKKDLVRRLTKRCDFVLVDTLHIRHSKQMSVF
ncbi:P-loop containing nucleoside triphosphate hydrolase protein [Suillus ampliporus]|nr:P-loop containing nucleoside triphosphate hydrolase protein [Suillus ampliporus]